MQQDSISVKPSTGALGAHLTGVNLSGEITQAQMEIIRKAFLEHLVLCFPNQSLSPSQHRSFAQKFGPLDVHPFSLPMEGYPEILEIVKEKTDPGNFGGNWHTDMTYVEHPPLGTMLVAREMPERGGDTLFANMYTAYDALSESMKELLVGKVCVHGSGVAYGTKGLFQQNPHSTKIVVGDDGERRAEHPLVVTHPETGRKSLFINPDHTYCIKGFSPDESSALLAFLYNHSTKAEFTYRHSWSKNSVLIWDNRCTQHRALNDYPGHRRVIHRIVIRGDKPR